MTNIDKLNEAINVIREECGSHCNCSICPLYAPHGHKECALYCSDIPYYWDSVGGQDD